jgi:CheY-like chemotaxis protein
MTVSANSNGKVILCIDDETTGLSVRKMLLESQGLPLKSTTRISTDEAAAAAEGKAN